MKYTMLQNIPCHSEAVERTVQDVTYTTTKVFGHDARHGMVVQCNKSREEMPKYDSKADFIRKHVFK